MQQAVNSSKDLLDVLIQLLIIVIPVVITWFIWTYVKSSAAETQVAAIVRLSNSAIDFVENLDKQGDLALPPDVKKSTHKLKLAGEWLESELQRAGIKITDKEAQQWIASEFQKRVGDVRMVTAIAELAREAVSIVQDLDRRELLEIPPDVDRAVHLAELSADWLIAQLARQGGSVSRDEALTLVRAEFLERLRGPGAISPARDDPLADLARRAVAFMEQLKVSLTLSNRDYEKGCFGFSRVAPSLVLRLPRRHERWAHIH